MQLAGLQREAADKKRALDSECEKLSREKHKRQRIEEDNKVTVAEQHNCRHSSGTVSTLALYALTTSPEVFVTFYESVLINLKQRMKKPMINCLYFAVRRVSCACAGNAQ